MLSPEIEERVVTIQIPTGVQSGSKLNIPLENGKTYEIIIPPNMNAGDIIHVRIPSETDDSTQPITINETQTAPVNHSSSKVAVGAAAVGAVLGILVLGPVTGAIVAGAAVYATTRSDKIGDAARGTGKVACNAYDKAVEADKKYGIFDRIKAAGQATLQKAAEIDQEYKITDKAQTLAKQAVEEAKKIDAKYEITDKAAAAITSGVTAAGTGLIQLTSANSNRQSTTTVAAQGTTIPVANLVTDSSSSRNSR